MAETDSAMWFIAGIGVGAGMGFIVGMMIARGIKQQASVTSFTYNAQGQITGVIDK